MAKKKTFWVLNVSYLGFDSDYDRKLEKIVGRVSVGSGFGLGGRDLDWDFYQAPAALAKAKLLRRKEGRHLLSLSLEKLDYESGDILEEVVLI